ncbi:MAG TPA: cytochrome-c oxidase, cbb3-type subunit III [Burkholderiales bacterium]|nr:cytochrome-c oxidase, cbb3-type subunit III [Burkholderiales bacterium]
MSDFTSGFWEWYVGVISVVSILACAVLLKSMSTHRVSGEAETTGHIWDEDLGEYNHPLPQWWIWLFYITIVFSLVYLLLYPGLGSYAGSFKWTSAGQYEAEVKGAEELYGPLYQKFASQDLRALALDPEARAVGQKLFLNHCAQCHGSDAAGGKGFPNLTDHDWLYGGEPETIKASIMNGRNGVMPALGPTLGEPGVLDAANYVLSLSGAKHDPERAARGKQTFSTICSACHGPDAKGNQALGAPNLTDNIWEYGGSLADIVETITKGRGINALTPGQSAMPAHKDSLGEAKVHILAAYVYGLSNRP